MQYILLRTAQSCLLDESKEFSTLHPCDTKKIIFSSLGCIDIFNPDRVFLILQFLL